MPVNPFPASPGTYFRYDLGPPPRVIDGAGNRANQLVFHVHGQLRAMMTTGAFPCILGRSAFANYGYRFGFYDSMETPEAALQLCHNLFEFAQEQPALPGEFSTFVAAFAGPATRDEQEFERLLWALLQRLHDADAPHHPWDPSTSNDPTNPNFAFSFAETPYFLVGMHGTSSRYSRRFTYPAIAFNTHAQFERLRADGKFDGVQKTIRSNDIKLQGDINPSLTNFGTDSEAKQYSGRLVEPGWACPFSPRR